MTLLRSTAGRLALLAVLVVLVVVVNVVRGAGSSRETEVEGLEVAPGDLTVDVRATGVAQAFEPVEIRAPLNGRLVEVAVEAGDQVSPSDLIARYDAEDLQVQVNRLQQDLAQARAHLAQLLERQAAAGEQAASQLTQAESRVRQARIALHSVLHLPTWDLERKQAEERLNEAEAALAELQARLEAEQVSAEEISAARTAVRAAEAALAQAQAQLAGTDLTNPDGGTVLEVLVEPGEAVTAGQLIARIARLDVVEVVAEVDETDIGRIKPGLSARVTTLAYPDLTFTAQVTRIAPIARRQGQVGVFDVTLRVENGEELLRPGMTVTVDIEAERRSGDLVVPSAALTVREGRNGVFVIQDGVARFRPVTTGLTTATQAAITGGLESGEIIVVGPPAVLRTLADGDRVRVTAADGGDS